MYFSHYLIFDPIPFSGGSKIAIQNIIALTNSSKNKFTIVTIDKKFWRNAPFLKNKKICIHQFPNFLYLSQSSSYFAFLCQQFFFTCVLLYKLLRISRVNYLIGNSSPGVDIAIYLIQLFIKIPIIQIVHGKVATSYSIGYCLTRAKQVFYLPSTKASLSKAIYHYLKKQKKRLKCQQILESKNFQEFINGIPKDRWPSQCQYSLPVLFWSASLLQWKGLELLIKSADMLNFPKLLTTNICFIRPKHINLPISKAPIPIKNFHWYEQPKNLDSIRQASNIFISTSKEEPFGLSILEAMASGMCVIIPKDGSYWDLILTHNINCIKYLKNNATSLNNAILYASSNIDTIQSIGRAAFNIANLYQAEYTYKAIINYLNNQRNTNNYLDSRTSSNSKE
ncbi:glycosyltransferase [Candidatus Photodesmus anomalopis]|uniref:Glycosyl transferases group I n=1 Tax=Candidatus Photodesmus katoptron Akat1 TaxID=1236703 RepID=S3DZN5_9GAMM|nr:glycosyltransferase [Candidatus Photodesmus katoptron]EPE37406.1 glycosyl transferases group I [Candidatus Photodesmus katoptron Akat1]